ncbi:MAG TPA: S9 family peptidase [Candidatus Acidoferrales bacterium]|nr:S9 family peptidase [Candidatus Acidoferrales bacterium]
MSEPLKPEDIHDFRLLSDPQVSPDGTRVAFVLTHMDRDQDQQRSNVWVVPADGSAPARQLTSGPRRDLRPRWSPDGRWLAFLSNREREWRQDLHLVDLRGGEPRRVAQLARGIEDFAWAPGSDCFALLGRPDYPADPERNPPADDEEARKRYQERVRHVGRFRFRLDGAGLLDDEPRRIWVCDREGRDLLPVTDGPYEVQRPRWTPDGQVAFLSNRGPDHERSDSVDLWRVPPGGGVPEQVNAYQGVIVAYSWSRAGVGALIGSADPDAAGGGRHLLVVVEARVRTSELDRTAGDSVLADTAPAGEAIDPQWSPDGGHLYFQVSDRGAVHVYRMPAAEGAPQAVVQGKRVVTSFSIGAQTLAFVTSAPDDPASLRVAALDGSEERVLFEPNPWVRERALGTLRELPVSVQGRAVDGWALLPPGHAEGQKVPTLLYIHGGPHAAYGHSFPFAFQILAGAGYAVVFCNPPGSQSYEEEFARAIHTAWGEADFAYFMQLVDDALSAGFADPGRLGVGGASYGGFSTLWVITHSDRFKAAVAARPVSLLQGFYGSSDIGWNFSTRQMRAEPWEQPTLYDRLSPATYLDRVQTPLRLIACLSDHRTPPEQAEQVFIRLRKLGKEVDLVLFHGESHLVVMQGKPWNRVRHMRAVLEWFDRHLKPAPGQA